MMTIAIVFSVLVLIATTPIAVRSEDLQKTCVAVPTRISMYTTTLIRPTGTGYWTTSRKRTSDFIQHQDGLLTDARATLFERALYQTIKPSDAKKFKKQPADVHDRLHMLHGDFYAPVPNADFVDVNEPYYFQMLAEQHSF
ncbi:putative membrane protein [Babesia divergens]|uniref:Membrane protein n=1 Tax=Babesia divergens TaxID=32595 RepID=A0AAD9GDI3_BABDI|nr:putative membrane protein [Babesia divergens]